MRRFGATGRIVEVRGLTVVANGPPTALGEVCRLASGQDGEGIAAQVVGFQRDQVLLLPLGRVSGLEPGGRVVATGQPVSVGVGRGALGRVLDAFGNPLDGRGPLQRVVRRPVDSSPPPALARPRVLEPVFFGVRVLDGLLTCGRGQRIGVFSGAGLGKSTLLGMIAANTSADIIVIALVGERGREVLDFLETNLRGGLARSVVVVATADEPALVRITAGLTATTIAEYFRDLGLHVVLIMDSLTRLARAQREVGLATGEAPATRGYPPSTYDMLPRLLERAGPAQRGAITGIYSVLVEGDDMQEPVADMVNAILDGHIILSRQLANEGHFPAVDVGASVSRLMPQVVDEEHWQAARNFRALLTARREVQDLLSVGAYRSGSNPVADRALAQWPALQGFLRQRPEEVCSPEASREQLVGLTGSL
jgi:flagellum-specific ATP synthase